MFEMCTAVLFSAEELFIVEMKMSFIQSTDRRNPMDKKIPSRGQRIPGKRAVDDRKCLELAEEFRHRPLKRTGMVVCSHARGYVKL